MKAHDITAAMVAEAAAVAAVSRPLGVSVLVASRDPEVIAWAGPRVAADLYPGRSFGAVIHSEPHPDPSWTRSVAAGRAVAGQWSEVIVEEGNTAP